MSLGLESFRGLSGRHVLAPGVGAPVIQKSELSFTQKLQAWSNGGSFSHGTVQDQAENRAWKAAFYDALQKAEGPTFARKAVRAAGLPDNWKSSPEPLGNRADKIMAAAQSIRIKAIATTNANAHDFIRDRGPQSLSGVLAHANAQAGRPGREPLTRELAAIFLRELRTDPAYGTRKLGDTEFAAIGGRAVARYHDRQAARLAEGHPGLDNYRQAHQPNLRAERGAVFGALKAELNGATGPLSGERKSFRDLATTILAEVQSNAALLGTMRYDPQGLAALAQDVAAKHAELQRLENQIATFVAGRAPGTAEGQALQVDLITELRHQQGLLLAKATHVADMQNFDPLSEKAVAYSNRLWGQAAGHVVEEASAWLNANAPAGTAAGAIHQLTLQQGARITNLAVALSNAGNQRTAAPEELKRNWLHTKLRGKGEDNHPAMQAKKAIVEQLKTELRAAGLPRAEVDRLVSKENLNSARRKALNENQTWSPVHRNMQVTARGVTRNYISDITFGAGISDRFARRYASAVPLDGQTMPHAPRAGISSAEKADHYHARNLKVSKLQLDVPGGAPLTKATVVGHGVLDMWEIPDAGERRAANERGAKEVLEAALVSNPRAKAAALNNQPIRLTHVSVNLTTPASWREVVGTRTAALRDYQEKTYTDAQFEAFKAVSSQNGQPVTITIDDDRNPLAVVQDQATQVHVDTIAFSFGINPMATDSPEFIGGWANVVEQNRRAMEAFVGDAGVEGEGRLGSTLGGFIGGVHHRLDPAVPAQAALANRIREQVDTVRSLFSSEAYKKGNGDPAKMGREVLALQSMAEEALSLMQDNSQAATMSKGCKSDKDRGGVTDVELKHKLISEEMGVRIRPDGALTGEARDIYAVVATSSGQLESQQFNTGFMGSKEMGKLQDRIADRITRMYTTGLGMLASE